MLAAAVPAAAESGQWMLRAKGLGTDYERRRVIGFSLGYSELTLDRGSGLELAAEYRRSR